MGMTTYDTNGVSGGVPKEENQPVTDDPVQEETAEQESVDVEDTLQKETDTENRSFIDRVQDMVWNGQIDDMGAFAQHAAVSAALYFGVSRLAGKGLFGRLAGVLAATCGENMLTDIAGEDYVGIIPKACGWIGNVVSNIPGLKGLANGVLGTLSNGTLGSFSRVLEDAGLDTEQLQSKLNELGLDIQLTGEGNQVQVDGYTVDATAWDTKETNAALEDINEAVTHMELGYDVMDDAMMRGMDLANAESEPLLQLQEIPDARLEDTKGYVAVCTATIAQSMEGDDPSLTQEEAADKYIQILQGMEAMTSGTESVLSARYGVDTDKYVQSMDGLERVNQAAVTPVFDALKAMEMSGYSFTEEQQQYLDSFILAGIDTSYADYSMGGDLRKGYVPELTKKMEKKLAKAQGEPAAETAVEQDAVQEETQTEASQPTGVGNAKAQQMAENTFSEEVLDAAGGKYPVTDTEYVM